jgi:hypothetical protein
MELDLEIIELDPGTRARNKKAGALRRLSL